MSDGAFLTGLRVFRARRHEFLEPRRTRRRTIVCGFVAFIVGAASIISDALTGWVGTPLLQTIVMAVAFAAATGCFAAVFFRTARKPQAQRWQPLRGGWRRSERIGQQFAARPPELLPEDRDEVLARAADTVEPAIASADRLRWIPFGWLAAWVGAGQRAGVDGEHLRPVHATGVPAPAGRERRRHARVARSCRADPAPGRGDAAVDPATRTGPAQRRSARVEAQAAGRLSPRPPLWDTTGPRRCDGMSEWRP